MERPPGPAKGRRDQGGCRVALDEPPRVSGLRPGFKASFRALPILRIFLPPSRGSSPVLGNVSVQL